MEGARLVAGEEFVFCSTGMCCNSCFLPLSCVQTPIVFKGSVRFRATTAGGFMPKGVQGKQNDGDREGGQAPVPERHCACRQTRHKKSCPHRNQRLQHQQVFCSYNYKVLIVAVCGGVLLRQTGPGTRKHNCRRL